MPANAPKPAIYAIVNNFLLKYFFINYNESSISKNVRISSEVRPKSFAEYGVEFDCTNHANRDPATAPAVPPAIAPGTAPTPPAAAPPIAPPIAPEIPPSIAPARAPTTSAFHIFISSIGKSLRDDVSLVFRS